MKETDDVENVWASGLIVMCCKGLNMMVFCMCVRVCVSLVGIAGSCIIYKREKK